MSHTKRERGMAIIQTVEVPLTFGIVRVVARPDGNIEVFASARAAITRCDELKRGGLPCHVLYCAGYCIQVDRPLVGPID